MSFSRSMLVLAVMLMAALTVGACQNAQNQDPNAQNQDAGETGIGSQLDLESVPCGNAYVDEVAVEETAYGEVEAVVTGNYPAACDQLGKVEQSVEGDTIAITMCSARPPGAMCAEQLTPFVETLAIDTEGLDAGTYTVDVNGVATTLTIE